MKKRLTLTPRIAQTAPGYPFLRITDLSHRHCEGHLQNHVSVSQQAGDGGPTTVSGWSRGNSQRRRRPTLSSTSDPSPEMSVYKRSVRRCGRRRRWRQCLGTPPDNKHEGGGTGGDA